MSSGTMPTLTPETIRATMEASVSFIESCNQLAKAMGVSLAHMIDLHVDQAMRFYEQDEKIKNRFKKAIEELEAMKVPQPDFTKIPKQDNEFINERMNRGRAKWQR